MSVLQRFLIAIVCVGFSGTLYASSFIVKRIVIHGNHHITAATVRNYMPIRIGQRLTPSRQGRILNKLYATGFFKNVALKREGRTLIVVVHERPTIDSVIFSGNSMIKSDKIKSVLKKVGLVRGRPFNDAVLTQVKLSLEQAYESQGHYAATVKSIVRKEPRGRVAVALVIDEGGVRKVQHIFIRGNHVFSADKIIHQMSMTTPKLWSFLTGGDEFSDVKMSHDLMAIRNFYLDHGYLKMHIISHQVTPSQNGKSVSIHINLSEGPQYHVSGFDFSGRLLGARAKLKPLVTLKIGEPVSRKKILATDKALAHFYGDRGYAFANIQARPIINEAQKSVFLTFQINPEQRVYVRHINFSGNIKTADYVLRRDMLQMEGGMVKVSNIDESMRRLRNLGYLSNVSVQTKSVPGKANQVDLDVHVKEMPSAEAVLTGGYGTDGFIVGVSVHQQNVLGTGNRLGLNFTRDNYQRTYSINYVNPFFTNNGVSQAIKLYANQATPYNLNLADYSFDTYGATLTYGIPVSLHNTVSAGLGLEAIKIDLGDNAATLMNDFVNENGRRFDHAILSSAWIYSDLDQVPFTRKGLYSDLGVQVSTPFGAHRLSYYKLTYMAHYFHPIGKYFIGTIKGYLGYGNNYGALKGGLPFFENFYAGGLATFGGVVRGYTTNTLGPEDNHGNNIGGNALVSGSLSLVFPNPISKRLRTSVFVDGGNVYQTRNLAGIDKRGNGLRYSAGLDAKWRVPVLGAVLEFSLAKALNPHDGDNTQFFEFSFGSSF